jgi:hypothetical protein
MPWTGCMLRMTAAAEKANAAAAVAAAARHGTTSVAQSVTERNYR